MQLASNTDNQDSSSSSSETQPILKNHLCEIIPIPANDEDDDYDNESSHLLVVNADHPQCRICLDLGGEDLIAPCHCKGTQKYVHRSCLDNWRSTKVTSLFLHSFIIIIIFLMLCLFTLSFIHSFSFPRRALLFLTVLNAELSS